MEEKSKSRSVFDKFFSAIELKSLKGTTAVLLAVCVVMLAVIGYSFKQKGEPEIISEYKGIVTQADEPKHTEKSVEKIFVHVKGEVESPGLYELEEDCRVVDAIDCAGGLTDSADVDNINLAEKLTDEAELYVPSKSETASAPHSYVGGVKKPEKSASKIETVNINTATAAELLTLPGIGGVYASRIIDFRLENGAYTRIEDIMKVKGISKGKFDMIKEYIRI